MFDASQIIEVLHMIITIIYILGDGIKPLPEPVLTYHLVGVFGTCLT